MQRADLGDGRARGLSLATYVICAALTSIAYIATFQNASIAAPEMTGSASTGGFPSSAAVLGTAIAAAALSSLMAVRGRRVGIIVGVAAAVLGSVLTFVAIGVWSLPLLLAGAFLTGFGNAAVNLSRYAAADLYPPERRASVVGIVVWGSTAGAVAGPNLVAPANGIGEALGLPHFAGGFAMATLLLALAVLVAAVGPRLRPEADAGSDAPAAGLRAAVAAVLERGTRRLALLALISGQLVMVLIMTMTPYHLHHTGHGDATVGFVISAHTFGMYALSPLSGRLAERFGAIPIIALGFVTLATAGLLGAAIPDSGGAALIAPLFLLGYGWNLGFVAASSLLASGATFAVRARMQGLVDAFVWGTAAIAGIVAGPVVERFGFAVLCLTGAALAVALAVVVAVDSRAPRSAAA